MEGNRLEVIQFGRQKMMKVLPGGVDEESGNLGDVHKSSEFFCCCRADFSPE